jgi:ABC-type branched-subunit amino acid transport system ATPase component
MIRKLLFLTVLPFGALVAQQPSSQAGNQQGVTILLVEQNAAMALSIAGRGYVLETGRLPLEGGARELADNPEVRRAYLGEA